MTALTFFLMPAPTTLYDAELNPIVELPTGYFVMQREMSAPDGYLSVIYDDLGGYVKAEDVQAVDYTPVTKYETTVTFTCDNDGQPVNLRASPRKNAQIIATLEKSAKGHCYGSIEGDALIADANRLWYYVNIDGKRGYCYYAHVKVSPTPPNIIEKEEPDSSTPTTTEPTDIKEPQSMSGVAAIIFIVALCIPVPFIMFYLFRKPKDDQK